MGFRLTGDLLQPSRIKDVRKRRAATPTAGGGADAASFNPFAAPAPAANPAPTQSTGFSFGQTQNQSQSFPGASSGPAQGGLFSSGTNGQTGGQPSFSFGAAAPSFGSQPAANPFSVNTSFGGDSQSATNGFSFGGFNSGGAATQATSTPTPAPAPSFGGFGAQQNTSTPSSGLFGQSTSHITSPADDSMQTSPDTKPKGTLFGAKPAVGGSPLANPFSSLSAQSAGNPFAPKPAATDDAAKPAEATPFKPLFGEAAASKPEDAKTQPAAGNLFAPKPASEGAASNPFASLSGQTAGSSNPFAPKTTAEQTPAKPAEAAKPFGALFGSTTTPKPAEPASNLFAPKPATEAPSASNPFANLSTPKVTETESAGKAAEPKPFGSLFGTPAPSKTSDAEAKSSATPAFGNMFATPKPADESAGSKASTQAEPFKSLFGTPAVSKAPEAEKDQPASPAFGNMFATPKPAAENAAAKPMFGAPATSKPAETEKEGTSTPAKTGEQTAATPSNPFASLSGSNSFSSPFGPKATETTQASPFGSSTALKTGKEAAPAAGNNNAFLNNSNNFAGSSFGSPAKEAAPPTAPSSQAPTDAKSCLPSSSSSIPSSTSTSTLHPYEASNTRTAQEADGLFPKFSTPPSIEFPDMSSVGKRNPPHEDGDDPASGEMYLKLVMATTSFIRHVSQCNPETDDIDEAIMFYAEIRREMGVPIGAIDPEEEKMRANINHAEAEDEAHATNQPAPTRQPTPPRFDAPSKSDANPLPGASDTLSKFKQSFSAPNGPASPAPAGSSTPAKAPAAPLSFTPAATPAASTPAIPKFGGDSTASKSSTPAPAFAIPKFGGDSTASKSSTPAPAFTIPSFGGGSTGGTDFMAEFKAKAEKNAAEEKAKRKAEDFDSEDDDEAEWERKDAEQQREKRAKLEAASGKRSVFVPGEGFKFVDDEPAAETPASASPAEPATSTPAASQSLFGANTGSSSFGGFSSSPASTSVFAAKPPAASTSMFAPSSTSSSTSSVFGSSQPIPSSQNIFGGLKPKSPKRKSSTDGGSDSDDESPAKKSKALAPASSTSTLFGRVSNPTTPSLTPPATNPFGGASPAPASPAASPAAINPFGAPPPPSDTPADAASETASTAVTVTEDGEGEPGEVFDLGKSNVGEEDESVEFEQKCRTFKLEKESSSWSPQGLGNLRLLKHPETGRARMVIRGDPNGNVILNTLLKKELDYSLTSNSVQLIVPEEGGTVSQYAVRVKKERLQALFDKIQEIRY